MVNMSFLIFWVAIQLNLETPQLFLLPRMKIKIKSVLETLAKMSEEIEQCFNAGVVDGFTKEFLPQIPPYILRLII